MGALAEEVQEKFNTHPHVVIRLLKVRDVGLRVEQAVAVGHTVMLAHVILLVRVEQVNHDQILPPAVEVAELVAVEAVLG